MNFCEVRQWLEKTEVFWPPENAEWIYSKQVQNFISSYNSYRQGHWKGAKGELTGVVDSHNVTRNVKKPVDRLKDVLCTDQIKKATIFESAEDPLAILHLCELDKYRQAYRRFRRGSYEGAHGEITNVGANFTRDQLRLLPVAALAQYLGYKKLQPIKSTAPQLHLHLGAGKLGLGLIAPALVAGGIPFAIYQRVSDEWTIVQLSSTKTFSVYINKIHLTDLEIIRSFNDLIELGLLDKSSSNMTTQSFTQQHIQEFRANLQKTKDTNRKKLLILCDEMASFFVKASDSFSSSLGPALLPSVQKIWSQINFDESTSVQAPFYGCENDHSPLEEIRKEFSKFLLPKECMVDRICSERTIYLDKVDVNTEGYEGQIVVSPHQVSHLSCAFGGPNVLITKTYGSYCYLYNRKFLIVNGTHTTFAFMTLRRYCIRSADAPGDFPLISTKDMTELELIEVKAWAVARCLLIFHNHDSNVIKDVHGLQTDQQVIEHIWDYAENMIKRLSSVVDSTKRVLGGGVENRYITRLKNVVETLQTFDKTLPFAAELFKHTGFESIEQLVKILSLLLSETERFVTLEPSTKPKHGQKHEKTQSNLFYRGHNSFDHYTKAYQCQFGRKLH